MDVLYDETGREVGRSCLRKIAAVAPIAAAPIAATAAAPVAFAATGGSWGWLKWLLLLLLLLALALFGLKKCQSVAPVVVPPVAKVKVEPVKKIAPKVVPKVEPVKVEPVKVAPIPKPEPKPVPVVKAKPVVVAIPKPVQAVASSVGFNNCGPSTTKIFNVQSHMTPKPLDALGTFPEFGDSHGLTASQFRDKLLGRAAISAYDARYLDYVARSMGYANFSAIPESAFSEENLPYGTTGLLGFGEFHGYAYSKLNTSDRDLESFRIEAPMVKSCTI